MTTKRLLFIFAVSAVIAHAIGSVLAGSFNPGSWSLLITLATVFVFAPCIALGICVVEGEI